MKGQHMKAKSVWNQVSTQLNWSETELMSQRDIVSNQARKPKPHRVHIFIQNCQAKFFVYPTLTISTSEKDTTIISSVHGHLSEFYQFCEKTTHYESYS